MFLPLTFCPPPKSSMVLENIYNMIIGIFKVKVCWILRAAIFVKMHPSSSSWFDPACHFKSVNVSCSLLNVLWILSQQMPSVLFCCCMNLLIFLSPDFKYVQVCVKVCVRGWISILFCFFSFLFASWWHAWMCFFLCFLTIMSEALPPTCQEAVTIPAHVCCSLYYLMCWFEPKTDNLWFSCTKK